MSCLAAVNTALGRVELHDEDGRFTTQRPVACSGEDGYVCTILVSREGAHEWYELAERQGMVYAEFPESVTA